MRKYINNYPHLIKNYVHPPTMEKNSIQSF